MCNMNEGMFCFLRAGWNLTLHVVNFFNTRRKDFNMLAAFQEACVQT